MRNPHSEGVSPLGELLKKQREKRGQSQDEAADELDVGQSRYQRWEALIVGVEPDRDLHERLRIYLELSHEKYAEAALEHSIRVKERRQ